MGKWGIGEMVKGETISLPFTLYPLPFTLYPLPRLTIPNP